MVQSLGRGKPVIDPKESRENQPFVWGECCDCKFRRVTWPQTGKDSRNSWSERRQETHLTGAVMSCANRDHFPGFLNGRVATGRLFVRTNRILWVQLPSTDSTDRFWLSFLRNHGAGRNSTLCPKWNPAKNEDVLDSLGDGFPQQKGGTFCQDAMDCFMRFIISKWSWSGSQKQFLGLDYMTNNNLNSPSCLLVKRYYRPKMVGSLSPSWLKPFWFKKRPWWPGGAVICVPKLVFDIIFLFQWWDIDKPFPAGYPFVHKVKSFDMTRDTLINLKLQVDITWYDI